jgi:hypothetical protein
VAVAGGHPDAIRSADEIIDIPEKSGLVKFLEKLLYEGQFCAPDS